MVHKSALGINYLCALPLPWKLHFRGMDYFIEKKANNLLRITKIEMKH